LGKKGQWVGILPVVGPQYQTLCSALCSTLYVFFISYSSLSYKVDIILGHLAGSVRGVCDS